MSDNAPGWQPDPTGRFEHRYWDGTQWTDHVADAGVAATDAYAPDADLAATADAAGTADAPDAPASAPAPDATIDQPALPPDAAAGWADPTIAQPAAPADTTAAWPAAPTDTTAAWPATPAPPAPPAYTPPPPPTGGPDRPAGSKRGLLIGGGILAVVAVAVAAFLLLGGDGDDDGDRIRAELAAQIKGSSDLSQAQAECVADAVVDDVGVERLRDVDFNADEPPPDVADDLFTAAFDSLDACEVDPADFSGGSSSSDDGDVTSGGDGTYGSDPVLDALYDQCKDGDYQACDDLFDQSPSGSEYEDFADSCGERNDPSGYCVDIYEGDGDGSIGSGSLPEDFQQQLADIYADSLGLPREKADCLAGKIADAVESGDLSEEQAMSDIFGYLSDCDIDMSEISGN